MRGLFYAMLLCLCGCQHAGWMLSLAGFGYGEYSGDKRHKETMVTVHEIGDTAAAVYRITLALAEERGIDTEALAIRKIGAISTAVENPSGGEIPWSDGATGASIAGGLATLWILLKKYGPKAGLMLNGKIYQRHSLARHINVSGYSYLPTCLATDYKGGSRQRKNVKSQLRHWITVTTGLPYPNPLAYEAMMGFPARWTELDV